MSLSFDGVNDVVTLASQTLGNDLTMAIPGMRLYWPMDRIGAAHATDYRGNGRSGPISGAIEGENPPVRPAGDGASDALPSCPDVAGAASQRLRLGPRAALATSP